ncbi:hypothetical protein V2J09_006390 [Rumex salicifolius]
MLAVKIKHCVVPNFVNSVPRNSEVEPAMAIALATKMNIPFIITLITALSVPVFSISSLPIDHSYNVDDQVPLLANIIGPLNNPSETYQYFDLPFCPPDELIRKRESLGQVLNGDRLTNSRYSIKFKEQKEELLCRKSFSRHEVVLLRDAVAREFYFQKYYDDLPFWGFIGKVERENMTPNREGYRYYLFSHLRFNVLYNGNHVIEMHAFGDPNHVVDITEDAEIDVEFTYSVSWNATTVQFQNRMGRYLRASSLPSLQLLHRFSFVNSFVIVLLAIGLFVMLHRSYVKNALQSVDDEGGKEVSSSITASDLFKSPKSMSVFCSLMGCGTQLLILVCCLFILAFLGVIHPYAHGTVWTSIIVLYTLTSPIAGYTAASFHCQFPGTEWMQTVMLASLLFMGPVSVVLLFLTILFRSYGITTALPFSTIMLLFLVYIAGVLPPLFLGGFVGHLFSSRFHSAPTRGSSRKITSLRWYRRTYGQMFLAGLLTFSAILVEYHQFLASMWSHKIYTFPSILFITFAVLIFLTAILSAGLTYVQLCSDDHKWWWRSVLRGGSAAGFMFLYSVHFYSRSNMNGLVQLCFFLGYSACICYAFFLMLGAVSFGASLIFVNQFYHSIKYE